mgnify:CR=1 FL=1
MPESKNFPTIGSFADHWRSLGRDAEARGLMNTGIEIRQDLISDAAGEKTWADRLARIFVEIETMLHAQQSLSA